MLTSSITLDLSTAHLTDEQFYQLCIKNPGVLAERTREGALILMPPVGGDSGNQEIELGADIVIWNRQAQLGKAFSSSTSFRLPGGSIRSPDAAWVEQSRWDALTPEDRRKFPPIAPDFVIEVRSPSDAIGSLQAKMQEYLDSGVRLGWLFNPPAQQVEVYEKGKAKQVLDLPTMLSGGNTMPGFSLRVSRF